MVVARGSMTLYTPGLDAAQRQALIVELGGSLGTFLANEAALRQPSADSHVFYPAYRDYPTAIIFVVLGWVCWVTLALSCALSFPSFFI